MPSQSEESKVRRWARRIAFAASALLLLTAVLPILSVDWWWVRIWDFPRLQLLFLYIAAAVMVLALGGRRVLPLATAAALLAGVLWQLYWVYPYLPMAPEQTKSAESEDGRRRIRIMAANVLMTNRSSEQLLEIIDRADPDVLVLTEPDAWWAEALSPLDREFPHARKVPLDNTYGMIVYSKLPLVKIEVEYLVEPAVPSIHAVVSLPSGDKVHLIAVHPSPPAPGEDTDERDAELVIVGKMAAKSKAPSIVVGDLNDVGWSANTRLFQEVSRLLDPRQGRGLYATFPAGYPLLRYPLDHLFHSDEFRLVSLEVLDGFGSDHLPMIFELSYEPAGADEQEAPPATPETHEEAAEQVEKAD